MANELIKIARGDLRVEIDPDYGGRVTAFHGKNGTERTDWFIPTPDRGRDVGAPHPSGMFPLVPFSNRIEDAVFEFEGTPYRLRATEAGGGNAIHGHGCRASWEVASQGRSSAMLTYRHDGTDWPSAYRVTQSFDLRDEGLVVDLAVYNDGVSTMPVGLGLHPFFPLRDGVRLTAQFTTIWPPVRGKIPDRSEPLPQDLKFAGGLEIPSDLDMGFGGWNGMARIDWPSNGMALEIACRGPVEHAIVYTPREQDFFCVEPVTHATNAINLAAAGVRWTGARQIHAGESFDVSVSFRPVKHTK